MFLFVVMGEGLILSSCFNIYVSVSYCCKQINKQTILSSSELQVVLWRDPSAGLKTWQMFQMFSYRRWWGWGRPVGGRSCSSARWCNSRSVPAARWRWWVYCCCHSSLWRYQLSPPGSDTHTHTHTHTQQMLQYKQEVLQLILVLRSSVHTERAPKF